MALGSTARFPHLCSLPSPPLYAKKFVFFFTSLPPYPPLLHSQLAPLSRLHWPFSSPSSSLAFTAASTSPNILHQQESDGSALSVNLDTEVEYSLGEEDEEVRAVPSKEPRHSSEYVMASLPSFPTPKLTIKERKELASYAHSLGKKLKTQQIGKFGVTATVASAMVESLEANELLKLKVHGTCPGELRDVITQLENATGSTAVSLIGRTLILYRPSLAMMKKKDAESRRIQQRKNPIKSGTPFNVQKKSKATRLSIKPSSRSQRL